MTNESKVLISRRFAVTLGAAWALILVAMPLGSAGGVAAGVLLGTVAFLGARVPRRLRVTAEPELGARLPAEGDTVPLRVRVRNRGHRTLIGQWRIRLPGPTRIIEGQSAGFHRLPRRAEHDLDLQIAFELFGLHRLGPLELRIEDPFAYAAIEASVGSEVETRVYPRRMGLRDTVLRAKQQRTLIGPYEVSQPGHGMEFFGLRDYVVGDRPRDVNWKASARVGRVIVNQHQKENDSEIVVLVDVRGATGVGRQTASPFAQSCRAALAVAEAHVMARDAVRFVAWGDGAKEDNHTGATRKLRGLVDLVVGLEPSGSTPLLDVVQRIMPSLKSRSPVMVFSPLVGDPTIPDAVSLLLSHEHPVRVLYPVAAWDDSVLADDRAAWDAAQAVEVDRLRSLGVAAAAYGTDQLLPEALSALEVLS